MTDAELILASRRDPAKFRELYDRLAEDLLAYFYRRVMDPEVAADLLAETFAVAFERRARFRDRGKPGAAWVYGIAAKELSHWYRRNAVELRAVQRLGMTELSAVELCRREGLTGPLVACGGDHGGVAVVPGRGREACEAAGFVSLGPAYDSARLRVAALERRILAIEESADCIAPAKLAGRVQRLLDGSGWKGWTVEVARRGEGLCGSISVLGGDGQRYISLWPGERPRTLLVVRNAPRRITNLLHSAEHSLLARLIPESGASCFTYAGLREHVRETFAAKGIDASVRWVPFPANTGLEDEDGRWTRYRAGCAIVVAGSPGADGRSAVIDVRQRR